MTATIVPIKSASDAPPNERERELYGVWRQAYDELREALTKAGWIVNRPQEPTQVQVILERLFFGISHYVDFHARRVKAVERALRAALASDAISDEQREDVLAVLYGAKGVGRDPKLLSEYESQLIDHYRTTDAAGKQMLRTLCKRLAQSSAAMADNVAQPADEQ
jgi:hypothetical protein